MRIETRITEGLRSLGKWELDLIKKEVQEPELSKELRLLHNATAAVIYGVKNAKQGKYLVVQKEGARLIGYVKKSDYAPKGLYSLALVFSTMIMEDVDYVNFAVEVA